MKHYTVVIALVGLFACYSFAEASECVPATDDEVAAVRGSFQKDLLDNESARFADVCKRTLTVNDTEPVVAYCGMVNAKNAYGAYVGFEPFYSVPAKGNAGLAQASTDLNGVPSMGYCLACILPDDPFEKCFQLRLKAIANSIDSSY